MEESNEKSPKSNLKPTNNWLRLVLYILTIVALVLILKPFNKSTIASNHNQYTFSAQTDSIDGYMVDYNGVIDFVAYPDRQSTGELFLKESNSYRFKFRLKSEGGGLVKYLINGVLIDSFKLITSPKTITVDLRKGDYFKIQVQSVDGSSPDVGMKIQQSNSQNQRLIYLVIGLYIICSFLLFFYIKGFHSVLPSMVFLLLVYNEHLYPLNEWIIPMIAFVLCFVSLVIGRFLLSKFPLKIVRMLFKLIYDYLLLGVIVILAGCVWNYKRFGFRTDYDTIVAVLQSNVSETFEFVFSELNAALIIGLGLMLLIPFGLLWLERNIIEPKLGMTHVLGLLVSSMLTYGLLESSNFLTEVSSAYSQYYEEIAKFNEVQQRFQQPTSIEASKDETGETYVFVIGESQSKEHMSLYGYHRKTTPFLDSMSALNQIEVFTDAYSSHTHTIMVLQDALTQSNQYNGLKYTEVPSLINVLNSADFETVWLSNQVKLSNWDNIVSAIASGCKKQVFVNKNIGEAVAKSPYDEALVPELEKILETNSKKNKAIFIHLLGNHGTYAERFPSKFSTLPSKGKSDFGAEREVSTWEAYDNSILYNDYVLSQIQDVLSDAPGETKLMTYFADHAEDLSGGRGHNSGQFTYRMTQIPMFVWADNEYKKRNPELWDAVTKAKAKRFSNDLFFQLALSLTGIESRYYNATYDITDFRYSIDTFKTKQGKLIYDSKTNSYTNTSRNRDSLASQKQLNRIGIHRVNSFGKLNEVQRDRFQVIELDVKIIDGRLIVGHGEDDVMSNTELKEYLKAVDMNQVTKIWLDVKNLNNENLQSCIAQLNKLDNVQALKKKFIVETSSKDYNVSLLVQQGYNVSYYLPTSIAELSLEDQTKAAIEIMRQLKYQKIRSVSFDASLYNFVKSQLKGGISPFYQFHTWNYLLNVRHGDFIDEIKAQPYFNDPDIKTILVGYPSVFNL